MSPELSASLWRGVVAAISGLLLVGATIVSASGCRESVPVHTVAVQRGSVRKVVNGVTSGSVRAERQAELAFGLAGRVARVNVVVGDRVRRGQVLAEVENEDLRVALAHASADLARARLLAADAIETKQMTERREDAKIVAETNFEKSLIRAPFDGIVAECNLEVGELAQMAFATPRPPIFLVDASPRYVRVEIDEVDRSSVTVGAPSVITILAARETPFVGSVRKIYPTVSAVKDQDRTTTIEITINDHAATLLPVGASADVEIETGVTADTLILPIKAVVGRGTSRHVFRVTGDKVRRVPVRVGVSNYDVVEIVSGVEVGDLVALPPERGELSDGTAILVQ